MKRIKKGVNRCIGGLHLWQRMQDGLSNMYDEELENDAADIWEKVLADERLQNVKAPSDMRENVFRAIRTQEAECARERLSDEDKELIRLGRIYRRKRANRKYLALAAVMILVLAMGVTSFGEGEKVFRMFKTMIGGKEQISIHSDNIIPNGVVEEEEVYAQIEEDYGIVPVRMMYIPEGMVYIKDVYGENTQEINVFYGKNDITYIKYTIRPNYRESSWNQNLEDELIGEYKINHEEIMIIVRKYLVEDETFRWLIRYDYRDVGYSIVLNDLEEAEVEKVVQNLYFYEN